MPKLKKLKKAKVIKDYEMKWNGQKLGELKNRQNTYTLRQSYLFVFIFSKFNSPEIKMLNMFYLYTKEIIIDGYSYY